MVRFFRSRRGRQAGTWLMELLVVVFGVLIALYAQQWASERQSREAAVEAEARIREEVFSNLFNDAERLSLHSCLKQRLNLIAARVSSGAADWRDFAYLYTDNGLFIVRRIYRTPSRSWIDDAYRGALTNGALDSVPPERRAQWSALYRSFAKAQDLNTSENELAPGLNSLWLDGALRREEGRAMLQRVAELDRINGLSTLIASQNFSSARNLGYSLSAAEWAAFRKMLHDTSPDSSNQTLAMKRRIYGDCVDPRPFRLFDPALKVS